MTLIILFYPSTLIVEFCMLKFFWLQRIDINTKVLCTNFCLDPFLSEKIFLASLQVQILRLNSFQIKNLAAHLRDWPKLKSSHMQMVLVGGEGKVMDKNRGKTRSVLQSSITHG